MRHGWSSTVGVALVALALVGCETVGVKDDAAGAEVLDRTGAQGYDDARSRALEGPGTFRGSPLDDPASPLSKRVIYFDFDSSEIRDEYRSVIEAHAAYLAAQRGASVTLEGHTDERGAREYNLGLGERRANTVRRSMSVLGVGGDQLRVVSYGEERPAAEGQDESAWRLNRRVEIVYRAR